jgi:DNA-binding transcriptional LysR family regulator
MEERLVKFAKIVDAGSFTAAAEQLRISQPALTTAVKKLERELGAELLIRGHQLTLTPAGQVAYQTGKSLITHTQNLGDSIRQVVQGKVPLNLGMIDSLAQLLFVEATYFNELEAQAQVSLHIDNSGRLIEQVSHDHLDLAIIARPLRLPASLEVHDIGHEPLVLVAHHGQQTIVTREIAAGRLQHVMSYNQASYTHAMIAARFAAAGIELQPTFHSTSPEIMLQLVLAGRGAAVLPYALVRSRLEQGELVPVAIGGSPLIRRRIVCIRRSGRVSLPVHDQLLAYAASELQKLDRAASSLTSAKRPTKAAKPRPTN